MRSRWLAALLLVVLTLAVFAQVRGHEFVRVDDLRYIVRNPDVRAAPGLASASKLFTRPHHGDFIPLTYLSLQLDHALFGMEPVGFHATNVALHALATLALFFALARATGALGRSAFVAAVFAVHPLHVESVAWAFERKDTLSGLFWMLGLYAYVRYAERPRPLPYAALLACLALGLLAKPTLVTLPFVLLLLDFWPLGRLASEPRRAVVEKLPLLVLVGAAVAVLLALHGTATRDMPFFQMPLPLRVMNALETYVAHVRESFWPVGLAFFYPHPAEALSPWRAAACGLALTALTAGALALARTRPYLAVGWLWYAVTLLPVSGLVLNAGHARADRNTYLPLVGLALAVAWGACDLAALRRRARPALAALGALAVAVLALLAWRQVGTWRDSLTLFERALAVTQENYLAHYGMARELHERGRLAAAERHYRESLRLEPRRPAPHFELAELLRERGRREEAARLYEAGIRIDPAAWPPRAALAELLVGMGHFARARPQLERVVAAAPEQAGAHALLAVVEHELGRDVRALAHNREALRLAPDLLFAANNLAWLRATSRDPAVRDPAEAVRLAEGLAAQRADDDATAAASLLDTLAAAYAAAGRFEEAVDAAERALALTRRSGDGGAAGEIAERLAGYRAGRAYVE